MYLFIPVPLIGPCELQLWPLVITVPKLSAGEICLSLITGLFLHDGYEENYIRNTCQGKPLVGAFN